jgi:hypothetical protein
VTRSRFDAVIAMAAAAALIGVAASFPAKAAEPLDGLSVDDVRALMDQLRLVRAEFALIRRIAITPSCLASVPQPHAYEVAELRPMERSAP